MFSDYVEFAEKNPTLLSSDEHKLRASFRLKNTNVTIANTLRRAIISDAPSVAFRTEPADKSDVVISVNTTPLVNEMIALRIGLIPINADPLTFDPEAYEFVLDMENRENEIIDVTASNFKVYKRNEENPLDEPVQVPTETFFPPDPITKETALITRLRPRWNPTAPYERLALRAKASISSGQENVRWSPTSQCSYAYTMVDKDSDNPEVQEYIRRVFNAWLKDTKKISNPDAPELIEQIATFRREFDTMEIQRCYFKDAKGEANDFTFFIESVGILTVPTIVDAGLASIIALMERYSSLDAELPDNIRLQQGDARFPCIDVYFEHEGHTLGNLLSTYLTENNIEAMGDPRLSYVGYKIPHPLRPEMFVRIALQKVLEDGATGMEDDIETLKTGARLAIAQACKFLGEQFKGMREAWKTLAL